jgi:hypothetical protein
MDHAAEELGAETPHAPKKKKRLRTVRPPDCQRRGGISCDLVEGVTVNDA